MNFPFLSSSATTCFSLIASFALVLNSCSPSNDTEQVEEVKATSPLQQLIQDAKTAHGISAWDQKDSLQADVFVNFGGNTLVDGVFTFEAHGPRARYDRADGATILFDGETCWITPAPAEPDPMARFHVLTWPWFLLAPFKMDGDGVILSDLREITLEETNYQTVFQEFESGSGDTPDDWYRLFINSETQLLDGMSYIVTYGKTLEEGNARPSIILYRSFTNVDGVELPATMEFWLWNRDTAEFVGESPKGTGTATRYEFVQPEDGFYNKPEGAVEIQIPQTTGS